MSVTVSLNGVNYTIPQTSETGWGNAVTSWIQAASNSTFQKNGGNFTLTSEADFGGTAGLKALYYKSRSSNIASSGVMRLANTDEIHWRDFANANDLELGVNVSDQLTWNGNPIVGSSALTASRALQSSAAGVIQASSVTSTELGYVSGVTSAIQTQINSKITSGVAAIVNADVSASAAIARSKLAAGSNNHVIIDDGSGVLSSEATLATSRGGLNIASYTTGDTLYASSSSVISKRAIGSEGQVYKVSGGLPSWGAAGTSAAVTLQTNTNYTATNADDAILFSTGATTRTLTLFAASGNSGKVIYVKKVDSGAGFVTIDANGSETIDGALAQTLYIQNDEVTILCDGSNWYIINQSVNYGTYTPTLTSSANVAASTAHTASFTRIGNTVTVSMIAGIDPSLATPTITRLLISLPIPLPSTNFADDFSASGTGAAQGIAASNNQAGEVHSTSGSNTVAYDFSAIDGANKDHGIIFTYRLV